MKLIYRGTTYDYDPTQAKIDHQPQRTMPYELMYCGSRYLVDPTIVESTAIVPRSYELMYRGNTYQVTRNESGEMSAITCSTQFFHLQTLKPPAARSKIADQHLR